MGFASRPIDSRLLARWGARHTHPGAEPSRDNSLVFSEWQYSDESILDPDGRRWFSSGASLYLHMAAIMRDRITILNILAPRQETIEKRIASELAELTQWYIEDGCCPKLARHKALKAHGYHKMRKWRLALTKNHPKGFRFAVSTNDAFAQKR